MIKLSKFETLDLPADYSYIAPDGSEIRLLPTMKGGGLCHVTLLPFAVSKAVSHKSVEEIWYFIQGKGQVWRKNGTKNEIVEVKSGTSITIPPQTSFQFKNTGNQPLIFLDVTMPPWPGPQEATEVKGRW